MPSSVELSRASSWRERSAVPELSARGLRAGLGQLFALAENALSAPVASELGWHLVWCEAIRPAAPMTPEQALESARDYLSQQSQRRHQRQWLAEMLARQPGLCG